MAVDSDKQYLLDNRLHELVDAMIAELLKEKPPEPRQHLQRWLGGQAGGGSLAYKAVIFDLDGCVTKTAKVHSRSWKKMFDSYLKDRDASAFQEFTPEDYLKYVDGKPRYDGVDSFLRSRDISLHMGDPSDAPDKSPPTCCSLGNRKNDFFVQVLRDEGVEPYMSSVRIMTQLRLAGVRLGLASSSLNAAKVLDAAQLSYLIEERVDGVTSRELGLKGKPAGDIFVTCAKRLGVAPKDAIVVEDATSGVAAGRAGKFRLVLGLAREDNEKELKQYGAHVVLSDFGNHTLQDLNEWFVAQQDP
eukprot:Hpha_TRINITY_DN13297_c0_g1::TRINITY_DN13297_c0_g1_i1::g.154643::m.154643